MRGFRSGPVLVPLGAQTSRRAFTDTGDDMYTHSDTVFEAGDRPLITSHEDGSVSVHLGGINGYDTEPGFSVRLPRPVLPWFQSRLAERVAEAEALYLERHPEKPKCEPATIDAPAGPSDPPSGTDDPAGG